MASDISKVGIVIKEGLSRISKTQSWLAEQVEVSNNAVSKWIKTGSISRDNISKIAYALKIPVQNLLLEVDTHSFNTTEGPDITDKVPLISWVQAGVWTEIIDNFAPGDAEEWLYCVVSHSDQTFVLRVCGESMFNPSGRPSFSDGDLIFVDPMKAPHHRSLVVVRREDEKEATFKQLIIENEHCYLKALNPNWPEQIIELHDTTTICGVVIFKGEKL